MGIGVRYRIVETDGQEIIEEIHKIVVYRFLVSDVEDPDLYAAEPLFKWQNSDAGKFIMKHAIETPEWQRHLNVATYGHEYVVVAQIERKKLSEFYLRFGKP